MEKYSELLFLKHINGFGNAEVNKRIALLHMCENIDELSCRLLEQGISEDAIKSAIYSSKKEEDKILADESIKIITMFDSEYPKSLEAMGNRKPVFLYAKGNAELLDGKNIAVIGTRKPSEWTEKAEVKIVEKIIKDTQATVVSGLALGCDRVGHMTALNCNGNTVAALPSGFNNIAPSSNSNLAYEIVENGGCLITEYALETIPQKYTYLERDCIVAALSKAILVMECDVDSGTMHTVNEGKRLKKKIACYLPEDTNKGNYAGNIKIINEGYNKINNTESLNELICFLNEDNSDAVMKNISMFEI